MKRKNRKLKHNQLKPTLKPNQEVVVREFRAVCVGDLITTCYMMPFTVHIPTTSSEASRTIRPVTIEIPVYYNTEIDDDILLPEAHELIEQTKREEMLK